MINKSLISHLYIMPHIFQAVSCFMCGTQITCRFLFMFTVILSPFVALQHERLLALDSQVLPSTLLPSPFQHSLSHFSILHHPVLLHCSTTPFTTSPPAHHPLIFPHFSSVIRIAFEINHQYGYQYCYLHQEKKVTLNFTTSYLTKHTVYSTPLT